MSKPYYLVCYGHVLRVSGRVDSAEIAVRETFGVSLRSSGASWLEIRGSGWAYVPVKERNRLKIKAAQQHYDKTGGVISGFEANIVRVKVPNDPDS